MNAEKTMVGECELCVCRIFNKRTRTFNEE